MHLKEENYLGKINSYSESDWKPLLDLIPRIEKIKVFLKKRKIEDEDDIFIYLDSPPAHKIVSEFEEIVYEIPIIIDFHWSAWDEGRKIVDDENFDFDTIDIPTKCKLITAICRNDRFCAGRLVAAFEEELILKILKSIKKQLRIKDN